MTNIFSFTVNPFQENSYVIINDAEALIIDPGYFDVTEFKQLSDLLEQHNAKPIAVLLTHAHLDHIFGVDKVCSEFGIPAFLHPDDTPFWDNFDRMGANYGIKLNKIEFKPKPILPGNLSMAGIQIEALFTPGHAPGHLSYYLPDLKTVISGDALFRESVGRTDLPMGDFDTLAESIRTQLYTLPDDTRVLSGHGPETTIGHEKLNNPFIRILDKR
jgi:glyoxylase-like metal-dependent hydrolase (beta-lactamase superfamily II)